VARAYNPSYSGGRDQEDYGSGQLRQKVCETPSHLIKMLGTVVHTCHPSYTEGRDQEDCRPG
jgi:hypothetical protein